MRVLRLTVNGRLHFWLTDESWVLLQLLRSSWSCWSVDLLIVTYRWRSTRHVIIMRRPPFCTNYSSPEIRRTEWWFKFFKFLSWLLLWCVYCAFQLKWQRKADNLNIHSPILLVKVNLNGFSIVKTVWLFSFFFLSKWSLTHSGLNLWVMFTSAHQ